MKTRPILNVSVTSAFQKAYEKLPPGIKKLAVRKDKWFRINAFDPRLRTHPLHGKLEGYWAYSINQQYRVLFKFTGNHAALYYLVGTHAIYR